MRTFIITMAALSFVIGACGSIASAPTETKQPTPEQNNQVNPNQSETSDFILGATPSASFDVFVSAQELSGNGVSFDSIGLADLRSLTGLFAYISRRLDQQTTIYTMDVFTNRHVAEYEATQVESLNLFLIRGDKTQAKRNMALWCQSQGPKTREEAEASINNVLCFWFFDVE